MTEYEMAALALAEASEKRELFQGLSDSLQGFAGLLLETNAEFISLLLGCLAVVYFLGKKRTKIQAIGVSIFYIFMVVSNRLLFYTLNRLTIDTRQHLQTLIDSELMSDGNAELYLIVTSLMVLASLFYMWAERRQS
jgi:formate hydrogenlyase subunit 3/multisubunit Na+/H+ antiporter MnhD subunit